LTVPLDKGPLSVLGVSIATVLRTDPLKCPCWY